MSGAARLSLFERYLSLWVALCIAAGVGLGAAAPGLVSALSRLEVRQVNLSVAALLATLVIVFAFQGWVILGTPLHIALIAVPLLLQVYVTSALTYGLAWRLRVPHSIAAPGALIGAGNFFALAVATTISLSMLSVCSICNQTRSWFLPSAPAPVGPRAAAVAER